MNTQQSFFLKDSKLSKRGPVNQADRRTVMFPENVRTHFNANEAENSEITSPDKVLNQLFFQIISEHSEEISKKLLMVDCRLGNMPHWVRFDYEALAVLLSELIENVIEFTAEGSISFSASVKYLSREDAWIAIFVVKGSGIGTGSGALKESQNPLFQQGSNTSVSSSGYHLGAGLQRALQIAKKLGGLLSCTSKLGQGSVFQFKYLLE